MDRNDFVRKLKESFKWLLDLDYNFIHVETNIDFVKYVDDEVYSIGISWAEYDVIKIHGIFARKRFNSIEKIIEEKTGNLNYTIYKKWEGSIPEEFDSEANGVRTSGAFYLSNENQIKRFSEIVKEFYTREILPFFSDFKSVTNILDWLSQNDVQEHSKLLVVQNNSMMLRKLVLMKEGSSRDFQSLYDRYRSFLEQKNSKKESPYVEMYDEFIKFDEYFYNHQGEA